MECAFCKIVKGEIGSAKIFEDDDVLAFLDLNPLTRGHSLIIPKKHFENIFDVDKEVLKKIIVSAKDIAQRMKKSLGAKGVNLVNASDVVAEQRVLHFHLHIVPRYKDDELHLNDWWQIKTQVANIEDLKKLAEQI